MRNIIKFYISNVVLNIKKIFSFFNFLKLFLKVIILFTMHYISDIYMFLNKYLHKLYKLS